jgi:diguanylate cyclase (GGDEF)-like protein
LLDVDNFKQINDRLGHATGDAALVHLAEVVRTVMRPQDMLARYGAKNSSSCFPTPGSLRASKPCSACSAS